MKTFAISSLLAVALAAETTQAIPLLSKRAKSAQTFVPPSKSPLDPSTNYIGGNNATLPKRDYVKGAAFDRIIHIWLENTDFESAQTTEAMQKLTPQGILFDQYYGVTHPSEPNYLASVAGDFFGMADDSFYHLPTNVTTLFDLLDDGGNEGGKPISYACYQENMPSDGFTAFNYTQPNYVQPGAAPYTYYVRKHNPCALTDYISTNDTRKAWNRNFNDLAADIQADALPQWNFITPNMVNDGHDTTAGFFSNWTEYFLTPLLAESRFNSNRTLVLLTFDESETYDRPNRIFTLALGNAVPSQLKNTTDSTYLTHYSSLSTVEANWSLKNLGRGDVNKTMANVYPFVASITGYDNRAISIEEMPPTNETGIAPGPFSLTMHTEFYAPDRIDVVGAGGKGVLVKQGLDTNRTLAKVLEEGGTANLTAAGVKNPWSNDPFPADAAAAAAAAPPRGQSKSAAGSSSVPALGVGAVVATVVAGAALLF